MSPLAGGLLWFFLKVGPLLNGREEKHDESVDIDTRKERSELVVTVKPYPVTSLVARAVLLVAPPPELR